MLMLRSNRVEISDDKLLEVYRSRADEPAFKELYRRYASLVFGVCMHHLKDVDASKDGVVVVFEKAMNTWMSQIIDDVPGWLYRVTRNVCLMEIRAQRRRENRNRIFTELHSESVVPPAVDDEVWAGMELQKAVAALNDHQRACIESYYFKKMSYHQVATAMGIEVKDVKSALQNARKNLRLWFSKK
jgi:RNA polymerase sigma factor (sigma-70 family)